MADIGDKLSDGDRVFMAINGVLWHAAGFVAGSHVTGLGIPFHRYGDAHFEAAVKGEHNKSTSDLANMDDIYG